MKIFAFILLFLLAFVQLEGSSYCDQPEPCAVCFVDGPTTSCADWV